MRASRSRLRRGSILFAVGAGFAVLLACARPASAQRSPTIAGSTLESTVWHQPQVHDWSIQAGVVQQRGRPSSWLERTFASLLGGLLFGGVASLVDGSEPNGPLVASAFWVGAGTGGMLLLAAREGLTARPLVIGLTAAGLAGAGSILLACELGHAEDGRCGDAGRILAGIAFVVSVPLTFSTTYGLSR